MTSLKIKRGIFTFKNVTPKQLAILIALVFWFISFILLSAVNYFLLNNPIPFLTLLLISILHTFTAFSLFYFALERFIYRRIKLIYKHIRQSKSPILNIPEKVDMNQHVIDDVDREVRTWNIEKNQEIENLKKMEQYRREFIGNIAHELKTPIYNIQGFICTLIDGGLYDEEINMSYLKKASQNVDRLGGIINDLDFISRQETGKLEMNWSNFKLLDLLIEVISSVEYMSNKYNIKIQIKEGSEKSVVVKADREKIRQVFTNLISNAIKYSKDKGNVWIGIYNMDKEVLIEITDNGIGIEEVHLPRLFERFYRVDSSRTRKQKEGGSGLGLAIVKHILEAHNQTIHVRSKVNVGSTFGFNLNRV